MDQYIPINPYIIRLLKKMNKTQGNYIYWLPKEILQVILNVLITILSNNYIKIDIIDKFKYKTIIFNTLKLMNEYGETDNVEIIYYLLYNTNQKRIFFKSTLYNNLYVLDGGEFFIYKCSHKITYDLLKKIKNIHKKFECIDTIMSKYEEISSYDSSIFNDFSEWSVLPIWKVKK